MAPTGGEWLSSLPSCFMVRAGGGGFDTCYNRTRISVGCRFMKYMGSKRGMLQNGLGDLLTAEAGSSSRVVDLFCGGASVSWFAATDLKKLVIACDLQQYAAILAGSVVKRKKPTQASAVNELWLSRAGPSATPAQGLAAGQETRRGGRLHGNLATFCQELCSSDAAAKSSLIWRCYGGHYFSPTQALSFDAMLLALPDEGELRELCLAATIISASNCAAAPGHTAQPFKATQTAARYLREAWLRDPFHYAREALKGLCPPSRSQPWHRHRRRCHSNTLGSSSLTISSLLIRHIQGCNTAVFTMCWRRSLVELVAKSRALGDTRRPGKDQTHATAGRTVSTQAIDDLLRILACQWMYGGFDIPTNGMQ